MAETPGAELRSLAPQQCLNLQGDGSDPAFRGAAETAIGFELPLQPCSWRRGGDIRAYWLGPGEWLLTAPPGGQAKLEQRLRESLRARFSAVDLSGGLAHFNLAGEHAGKVLQKSSPYDFHPRNFPPGRCVRTVFAKAGALVAAREDGSFNLVVRRSYASYLARWIADAAAEYGYAENNRVIA